MKRRQLSSGQTANRQVFKDLPGFSTSANTWKNIAIINDIMRREKEGRW